MLPKVGRNKFSLSHDGRRLESVCSANFSAATGPGAGLPGGSAELAFSIPVRRARRIGPPDDGPVPPDLAPNHSVKPAFHLALVSSDLEFLFRDMYLYLVLLCFACVFRLFLD
jgi:hypothetical protein